MKNEFIPEDQSQLQQFLLLERPEFMMKLNQEKTQKKRDDNEKKLTKSQKRKKQANEQKSFMGKIKTWQI